MSSRRRPIRRALSFGTRCERPSATTGFGGYGSRPSPGRRQHFRTNNARENSLFLFRLFRHPIETVLHLFHLAAQIVHVVVLRSPAPAPFPLRGGRAHARRHERLEHRERLLKQFHVAANVPSSGANGVPLKVLVNCLRNFPARASAYRSTAQDISAPPSACCRRRTGSADARKWWAAGSARLVFLFEDDLGQYRAGDVIAGLGVVDEEILAVLDHRREVLERHIGARAGIIEAVDSRIS